MSEKRMAACLAVSEIQRQKWSGGSFHPPLAGIRVKSVHSAQPIHCVLPVTNFVKMPAFEVVIRSLSINIIDYEYLPKSFRLFLCVGSGREGRTCTITVVMVQEDTACSSKSRGQDLIHGSVFSVSVLFGNGTVCHKEL